MFRAVVANLLVATLGGLVLLAWDVASPSGAGLGAFAAYALAVVVAGSVFTYLWVPLPVGAGGRPRRSAWSALLGFFASLPIVYLVLVVAFQLIRPALG